MRSRTADTYPVLVELEKLLRQDSEKFEVTPIEGVPSNLYNHDITYGEIGVRVISYPHNNSILYIRISDNDNESYSNYDMSLADPLIDKIDSHYARIVNDFRRRNGEELLSSSSEKERQIFSKLKEANENITK